MNGFGFRHRIASVFVNSDVPRTRGTKLAHFEIKAQLGSGGMGDGYQATVRKLGRDVAIKLLSEIFQK
jgi:hypothetical protein